jgi:hypothetical protein
MPRAQEGKPTPSRMHATSTPRRGPMPLPRGAGALPSWPSRDPSRRPGLAPFGGASRRHPRGRRTVWVASCHGSRAPARARTEGMHVDGEALATKTSGDAMAWVGSSPCFREAIHVLPQGRATEASAHAREWGMGSHGMTEGTPWRGVVQAMAWGEGWCGMGWGKPCRGRREGGDSCAEATGGCREGGDSFGPSGGGDRGKPRDWTPESDEMSISGKWATDPPPPLRHPPEDGEK